MGIHPDPIFVDTNVLIHAWLALSPFHPKASAALEALAADGAQVWLSRQIMREYLAGMTRPCTLTANISAADLAADIRAFAGQFFVAEDGPAVTNHHLHLFVSIAIAGKQVHDANIVATMLANGIPRLLTHNTDDFQRFAHLITLVPLLEFTSTVEVDLDAD